METQRFRNHFSYIIEQIGGVILALFAFLFMESFSSLNSIIEEVNEIQMSFEIITTILVIIAVMIIVLAIIMFFPIRRWMKTWIIIDYDTITVERNTIRSVKNTVGIKNISNVNLTQNLFEMLIGTCKIQIDTNSFSTANSTDLKIILKKNKGEELRSYLNARVEEINTGKKIIEQPQKENYNIDYDIKVTSKDILTNGFYSLNIFTIIALIFSLAGFISGFILEGDSNEGFLVSIGGMNVLIIIILGTIWSITKSFLKMYDFRVRRDENKLYINYGIYNKVDFAIPVDKINAIVIHQTFIARIFRKYSAEIVNVGLNDEEDKESAYFSFYCSKEQLKKHIDKVLPEFNEGLFEDVVKQPKSIWIKNVISYIIKLLFMIVAAICIRDIFEIDGIYEMVEWAVVGILAVLLIIEMILNYIASGTLITDNLLGVKNCSYGTTYSLIKYNKIQYMEIKQNLLEKKLGIVKGELHILASMTQNTHEIPMMTEDKVEIIKNKLL